jgi:two-component system sensor histidine kinase PilS (NtrC family)
VALAVWGVHASALLVVALLASALARELRVAGERLDARTHDLARLRWLHERTVESLTSGLLTLGPDGRVTSFNPEAERITGRPADEVKGQPLDAVLPGASEILREGAVGPRGRRGRRRLGFVDARGGHRHLGLAGSVLRDADGRPSGNVLIFQDVTDVVAMEQGLRRSERLAAVGQLAADIAHEIRNPLAAISGCVEMLRSGRCAPGDAEARRLMDIVIREIERLDHLITDFLQYARPAPPKPQAVELAEVLGEIAEMCRHGLPPEIAFELDAPAGLRALADATQLRQALWNLVTNARQAMPEGGRLRVAARAVEPSQDGAGADRKGGMEGSPGVEICVSDTGTGIPPEIAERIFDPFFTTKAGGTGLGLATVHRIVESHQGSIQVESRAGEGTCFRLRLARAEEAA